MKPSNFIIDWIKKNNSFDSTTAALKGIECDENCEHHCNCIDNVLTNVLNKLLSDVEDAERIGDL